MANKPLPTVVADIVHSFWYEEGTYRTSKTTIMGTSRGWENNDGVLTGKLRYVSEIEFNGEEFVPRYRVLKFQEGRITKPGVIQFLNRIHLTKDGRLMALYGQIKAGEKHSYCNGFVHAKDPKAEFEQLANLIVQDIADQMPEEEEGTT